jgi:bacterioferritin-associated ferredoxin
LPDFVQDAGTDAAVAYQYAIDYPEILEQIPCHCGCEKALAHKDNLACYITGFNPDGSVTQYDPHAAYCGVCLDITRQVMKLVREGKAVPEIHRVIDTQYSYSGPHPHVIGSVQ